MRDINRIDTICAELAEIWKKVPVWRLTQLMCNFQCSIGNDGYYLEDDEFIKRLKDFIEQRS